MIEIKITTSADKTEKMFIKLNQKIDDIKEPLEKSGLLMIKSINDNFESQGRPSGWQPLSPMTLALRKHGGSRILQDTGTLKRSITYNVVGKDRVKIGTNLQYASKLQFGGENVMPAHIVVPTKKKALHFFIGGQEIFCTRANIPEMRTQVPPRPFIMFQEQDKEDIIRIFNEHLKKSMDDSIEK